MPFSGRELHFVGIAGAGMSGLALVSAALGATVTGSDRATTGRNVERLRAAGIEPAAGHDAAHVPPTAELVVSSAIAPQNPERTVARDRGQRELHRADLLGELTRIKPTIAISGTHGKTTTTSMVVHALRACGMDPSYLVGGDVRSTGTNAAWGSGEWLVVEADESDRSLLKLHPRIAVVTNAELDHHATYSSLRDVLDTFKAFVEPAEQVVVWDRPPLRALRADAIAYDVGEDDVRTDRATGTGGPGAAAADASAGGIAFTVDGVGVDLAVPGLHNARNAAAALTACRLAGADPARAAAGLADFTGAGRRFELLGVTPEGARVVDDYAHHPTEVAATLDAARSLDPRRVVAVFQPHLYSRTRAEATGFGGALAAADVIVVTGIYAARERQEDFAGVSGLQVAEAAADAGGGKPVAWMPTLADAEAHVRRVVREGDLVLTLGAGDVDSLGRALVA